MQRNKEIALSILIPCYNEENRLGITFQILLGAFKESPLNCEIIFIDDGSTDNTYDLLKKFSAELCNVSVIKNKQNTGKGFSIKNGVQFAKGKYLMFIDADLSYDLNVINHVMELFENEKCDLVIGDRNLKESKVIVKYPPLRKLTGKLLSVIISKFVIKDIRDSQCGLKFFKTDIAQKIFDLITIPGFGFDIEVLTIAIVNNLKIVKVPVILSHSNNSSVKVFRDSCKILLNIVSIISNRNKGKYILT